MGVDELQCCDCVVVGDGGGEGPFINVDADVVGVGADVAGAVVAIGAVVVVSWCYRF